MLDRMDEVQAKREGLRPQSEEDENEPDEHKSRYLTLRQYYAFHSHIRPNVIHNGHEVFRTPALMMGRLTQQYLVDAYIKINVMWFYRLMHIILDYVILNINQIRNISIVSFLSLI